MSLDRLVNLELNDNEFVNQIILPAFYPMAASSRVRFSVQMADEQIIICSNDYANSRGLKNFQDAMLKYPDKDYQRMSSTGSREFNIAMNYMQTQRRSHSFIYKEKETRQLFMTVCEPIINFAGEIIGRKDTDTPFQAVSHRNLIEQHYKQFGTNISALVNITDIRLTEQEELILFMLIGGYSQQEIAQFLHVSRALVFKIIAERLCVKFDLSIVSTKVLVEKAISYGFANFVPEKFITTLNSL